MKLLNILISFWLAVPAQVTLLPHASAATSSVAAPSAAEAASSAQTAERTMGLIGTYHNLLGLLQVDASPEDRAYIDELLKTPDAKLPKTHYGPTQFTIEGQKYTVDYSQMRSRGALKIDGHEFLFEPNAGLKGNMNRLAEFFQKNGLRLNAQAEPKKSSDHGFNVFRSRLLGASDWGADY